MQEKQHWVYFGEFFPEFAFLLQPINQLGADVKTAAY